MTPPFADPYFRQRRHKAERSWSVPGLPDLRRNEGGTAGERNRWIQTGRKRNRWIERGKMRQSGREKKDTEKGEEKEKDRERGRKRQRTRNI